MIPLSPPCLTVNFLPYLHIIDHIVKFWAMKPVFQSSVPLFPVLSVYHSVVRNSSSDSDLRSDKLFYCQRNPDRFSSDSLSVFQGLFHFSLHFWNNTTAFISAMLFFVNKFSFCCLADSDFFSMHYLFISTAFRVLIGYRQSISSIISPFQNDSLL